MKLIKITPTGEVSLASYDGKDILKTLRHLIDAYTIEHVRQKRLYNFASQKTCMMVDEEGLLKGLEPNPIGSFLYESDIHGWPIVGNIVIAWEDTVDGEYDITGIPDSIAEGLFCIFKAVDISVVGTERSTS